MNLIIKNNLNFFFIILKVFKEILLISLNIKSNSRLEESNDNKKI
jgi:hypothetical protein